MMKKIKKNKYVKMNVNDIINTKSLQYNMKQNGNMIHQKDMHMVILRQLLVNLKYLIYYFIKKIS